MNYIYKNGLKVSFVSAWAPGIDGEADWNLWVHGKKSILKERILPKLDFTDTLFKRRLSQITRMTVQTIHDLLEQCPEAAGYKFVFVSFRGEVERSFSINRSLVEDCEVYPAAFSLSVFNISIAMASIAFNLRSGYSAIFPSEGDFISALKAAFAPILCGDEEKIVLVYADEVIPPEYETLYSGNGEPLAFALVAELGNLYNSDIDFFNGLPKTPSDFLKQILKG